MVLFNNYNLWHKRGGIPLLSLPAEYLECLDAELHGEAARERAKSERDAQRKMLADFGVKI